MAIPVIIRLVEEIFRVVVQFLHVFSGLMWLGGGFYTIFVQTPALLAAPPGARGPVLGQIIPRQVNYLLRLGEATIALGVLNLFASGKARLLENVFGSRWAIAILVGAILGVTLLAIGHAILKPSALRLLELGPRAGGGDSSAAAEMGAIIARLRTVGFAQIALGLAIVGAMVVARFS
ncbi:MAG TPA: hypothetical protein VM052_05885 [Candidatus Limnocylindrales bacterium]|nr:hypothetical protein [Candidatus Limnocylindrales bacterium]